MLATKQQQTKKKCKKKQVNNCLYNIENIFDIKTIDGQKLYLVKWEGYGDEENTWEPYENLATAKKYILELENKSNLEKKLFLNINSLNISRKNNKNKIDKKINDSIQISKRSINKNIQNEDLIVISSDCDDTEESNENEIALLGKKRKNANKLNYKNFKSNFRKENSNLKNDKKETLEEKLENIANANIIKNSKKKGKINSSSIDHRKETFMKIDNENVLTLKSPITSESRKEKFHLNSFKKANNRSNLSFFHKIMKF